MDDLISRQALCEYALNQKDKSVSPNDIMRFPSAQPEPESISKWKKEFREYVDSLDIARDDWKGIIEYIDELPSAEPYTTTHDSIPAETGKNDGDRTSGDCISRQMALETIRTMQTYKLFAGDDMLLIDQAEAQTELMMLPTVQPDIIRCKDCKYCEHWYADKGRCFLWHEGGIDVFEEGFCNYAERRTDG